MKCSEPGCVLDHHCPECKADGTHSAFKLKRILGVHRAYRHKVPGTSNTSNYRRKLRDRGAKPRVTRKPDLSEIELIRRRMAKHVEYWVVEFDLSRQAIVDVVAQLLGEGFVAKAQAIVDVDDAGMTGGVIITTHARGIHRT